MYLYDKNGDKIEVYSMIPNKDKIYKFKKDEMKKIPKNVRVLKAITNSSLIFENPQPYMTYLSQYVYQKPIFFNRQYHDIVPSDFTKAIYLTELYSRDEIKYKIPICIDCEEEYPKYLLFTEFDYKFNLGRGNDRTLDNIICLTKDLYLLEQLLDRKLSSLKDENIKNLIPLFNISNKPIDIIDIGELQKADMFNLVKGCELIGLSKVEESQKILKHIRK